jgi:hypothetical protein
VLSSSKSGAIVPSSEFAGEDGGAQAARTNARRTNKVVRVFFSCISKPFSSEFWIFSVHLPLNKRLICGAKNDRFFS